MPTTERSTGPRCSPLTTPPHATRHSSRSSPRSSSVCESSSPQCARVDASPLRRDLVVSPRIALDLPELDVPLGITQERDDLRVRHPIRLRDPLHVRHTSRPYVACTNASASGISTSKSRNCITVTLPYSGLDLAAECRLSVPALIRRATANGVRAGSRSGTATPQRRATPQRLRPPTPQTSPPTRRGARPAPPAHDRTIVGGVAVGSGSWIRRAPLRCERRDLRIDESRGSASFVSVAVSQTSQSRRAMQLAPRPPHRRLDVFEAGEVDRGRFGLRLPLLAQRALGHGERPRTASLYGRPASRNLATWAGPASTSAKWTADCGPVGVGGTARHPRRRRRARTPQGAHAVLRHQAGDRPDRPLRMLTVSLGRSELQPRTHDLYALQRAYGDGPSCSGHPIPEQGPEAVR